MSEEINDPIAALDQALRAMTDFARTLYSYYGDLQAAGFTADEAMQIVIAFQMAGLAQPRSEEGE